MKKALAILICASLILLSLRFPHARTQAQTSRQIVLDGNDYVVSFEFSVSLGTGITKFDLDVANATSWLGYQVVKSSEVTSDPQPDNVSAKQDADGNWRVILSYAILGETKVRVRVDYEVRILDACWNLSEEDVGGWEEIPDPIRQRYTRPQYYIDCDNESIAKVAESLKKDSMLESVKTVVDFVRKNLTYQVMEEEHKASWALLNGVGDCTEFSYLTAALLRAMGIPARVVVGWALLPENGDQTGQAHAWNEVYLPRVGWVPVDSTWGMLFACRHFAVVRGYEGKEGPWIVNASGIRIGFGTARTSCKLTVESVSSATMRDYVLLEEGSVSFERRVFLYGGEEYSWSAKIRVGENFSYSAYSFVECSLKDGERAVLELEVVGEDLSQWSLELSVGGGLHVFSIATAGCSYMVSGNVTYFSASPPLSAYIRVEYGRIKPSPIEQALREGQEMISSWWFPILVIAVAFCLYFAAKKLRARRAPESAPPSGRELSELASR